jgi:hypothetical protein
MDGGGARFVGAGRWMAAIVAWTGLIAPAMAAIQPVGIWTMTQDGTARQCRIQLREDPLGTGHAVAMPPGCHRAFPVLTGVRSWVMVDDAHLTLNNDADAAVLLFEDDGTGHLHALGAEGSESYALTAIGQPSRAPAVRTEAASSEATDAPVVVARHIPPPVALTVSAVAGHYAVLRGSRDTGCMVTLEEPGKTSSSRLKAMLAPACRDQGIIVFDPVGWDLKAGRLVLTARKGHTADLERDETGIWVKTGKAPQPLGLKRL